MQGELPQKEWKAKANTDPHHKSHSLEGKRDFSQIIAWINNIKQ